VEKPWNNNATVCREWRAQQKGKTIIKDDDLEEAGDAAKRLLRDDIIFSFHRCCDTQVLVEGQFHDTATGLFIPVRCLMDYVPRLGTEFETCLGDLKTSTSGSPRFFQRNAYSFGYHMQAAFDIDLYNSAMQEKRDKWLFVGIENFRPWQPFRRMFDDEFITIGRQSVETALRYYAKCLKEDRWPSYDDNDDSVGGWGVLSPEPWMAYEALSNKMQEEVDAALTVEQAIEKAGL
jgi:hypothetical protein